MTMIDANTPQPVILIKSAIVDELLRIHAPDVQGEHSIAVSGFSHVAKVQDCNKRNLNMTMMKKTSVVEWATQEVGVACDMVQQTTVEEFDFQTGESLGEYKFEPVVIYQLAEGWS